MHGKVRWALQWGVSLLGGALGACSQDEPADPAGVDATAELRLGAVNYVLDGVFAPYLEERRSAVAAAIADTPVDVLCASQVMLESDKQMLADAARESFPYSVWIPTDAATPTDDPRDASGQIPVAPQDAPCEAPALAAAAQQAVACAAEQCSTVPGSDEGASVLGTCMVDHCITAFAPLLFGDASQKRCFSCLLYSLMSHVSFAETQESCATDPRAGFAFRGDNSYLLISRYPLSEPRVWTLPSTAWRQVVLSARVTLPNQREIDVHCTNVQGRLSSSTQPYVGLYGNGAVGDDAWLEESLLQATRIVERVQQSSPTGRAFIMGDMYAGPAVEMDGQPVLVGVAPVAFDVLDRAFERLVAPGYEPACTVCASNPVVGGSPSADAWTAHLFAHGTAGTVEVLETGRLAMERTVLLVDGDPPASNSFMAPITSRYGLWSRVRISP